MSTSKAFSFTNFYQNFVMVMDPLEVGSFAFCLSFQCFMYRVTFWTKVLIFLWLFASTMSFIFGSKFLFLWIVVVLCITRLVGIWRRFLWTIGEITTDGDKLFQWSERKCDQHRVWRNSSCLETDLCDWADNVVLWSKRCILRV